MRRKKEISPNVKQLHELFFTSLRDQQVKLRAAFISLLLSLFFFANQCFHVPYSALTMFISSEQKERDSATAYSEYHSHHVRLLFSK